MNITWIPRTLARYSEVALRSGVALGVALTTLAWSCSGTVADAQQVRSLQHGGQSFAVVPASQATNLMSMPSFSAPLSDLDQAIAQVGYDGGSCASGRCGSGRIGGGQCGNGQCSGQCGGDCGGSQSGLNCPTCDPYRYGRVDALMMRRQGLDRFTRSREFSLDEYDFEFAPRFTFGIVPDCVSGTEVSFTGPLNWDMSRSVTGRSGQTTLAELIPGNLLTSPILDQTIGFTQLFDTEDPVGVGNFPDDPVGLQRQHYESTYWSVEASKTSMAWDIAKLLIGARYISFEEEYSLTASNGAAAEQNGFLLSNTTNNLIGLQVGIDMFTPVYRNTSTYLRARAGGYWNMSEATAIVDDQTERLYGMRDEDGNIAGLFELSNGVHYKFGEMLSVHAGSEVWYLAEVATAERQIPSLVGARASSQSIETGDDVLFVGFSFGATLKY